MNGTMPSCSSCRASSTQSHCERDRSAISGRSQASFTTWAASLGIRKKELPQIVRLRAEIARLAKVIRAWNREIEAHVRGEAGARRLSDWRMTTTVLALFLQEYECRVLEAAYSYSVSAGLVERQVAVLCADGLMIEKRFYREDLCDTLSKVVLERTGFALVFVKKEMNDHFSEETIARALLG